MNDLKQDIKQLIITSLNLDDIKPEQIVDDAPLFQEGLGLDSIDALELAVAIERKYRVTIPDEAVGKRAFFRLGLPMPVVQIAAAASQLYGKVTRTAQMLTLDKLNELKQRHWVCEGSGARRELGWQPRTSWAEGVTKAVAWYRQSGWL